MLQELTKFVRELQDKDYGILFQMYTEDDKITFTFQALHWPTVESLQGLGMHSFTNATMLESNDPVDMMNQITNFIANMEAK